MSSSSTRRSRQEEVDKAYKIQVEAATWGAGKYTTYGLGLATLAHCTWPIFRRQTLAFKGFLVSASTIFGLVTGADKALLSHEKQQRITEGALRKEARMDLGRRGLVATETEIIKWKEEKAKKESAAH